MKTLHYLFLILIANILFASCSTHSTISVQGNAGTEIYSPYKKSFGVIGESGKIKITLSDDDFYAYMLSKSPNSDMFIPFALDYKKKKRTGEIMLKNTGMFITTIGLGTVLGGGIALLAGEDETGGTMAAVGAGITGLGAAIGGPASSRLNQTSHEYQFKYLDNQRINSDIQFTRPVFNEPFKNMGQSLSNPLNENAPVAQTVLNSSSKSRKRLAQKSSKSFSDYGRQIEGEYVGTGTLKHGSETIEHYTNIMVKIVREEKEVVYVNVQESNGNDFFESTSKYKVARKANGAFILTHTEFSSVTIKIDKNKRMEYLHPKVNIDGDIYTLRVNAEKQETDHSK